MRTAAKIEEPANCEMLIKITKTKMIISTAINPNGTRPKAPKGFKWYPAIVKSYEING